MNKIQTIYKTLHKTYGPQGWWPLSKNSLYSKHHNGPPKSNRDVFEIIVGAILTQNTTWKNVEKTITLLNKNKLMDPKNILAIPEKTLAKIIRSSGYYNQKAIKLKIIAKFLYHTKFYNLLQLSTNDLRNILLKIKGIGPETADSIVLYAFEKPIFVVDAYTKRIFSRLGLINENNNYDEVQQFFHKHLRKNLKVYKEYHALIVKHAKMYCHKKPLCKECILRKNCKYYADIKQNYKESYS
ncbi:endonuclease [Candidatus Woesearchaeota archaeon]|nr:MAG: endonuclease [Candidatus Woesearchaeota archaeon]